MQLANVQKLAGTSKGLSIVFRQLLRLWGDEKAGDVHVHHVFMATQAHLITVGVISAQKKMLSVLTA